MVLYLNTCLPLLKERIVTPFALSGTKVALFALSPKVGPTQYDDDADDNDDDVDDDDDVDGKKLPLKVPLMYFASSALNTGGS